MRKINYHNLLKSLNSLCKFLDDTYNVNSGGCCFLAAVIAKHLDKLGLNYDLVIYDYYEKDQASIEHEVIALHKNKDISKSVTGRHSCSHYCLNLIGAGIINDDDDNYHQYFIPDVSYKNIYWIYKRGSWNDCYEVRHNKTIKNIVKEFFKEYEKVPNYKIMHLSKM